jgi:hypothetical protein
LDQAEHDVLRAASLIYRGKRFEYVEIIDAAHGFERFPDLDVLVAVARKLVSSDR